MGSVEGNSRPPRTTVVRICRMGGNKRLRLRRYWCENTFLIEPQAIGAPSIWRRLKSRASNLLMLQLKISPTPKIMTYLTPPTVPASNCRSLSGSWLLKIGRLLEARQLMGWNAVGIHLLRGCIHVGLLNCRAFLLYGREMREMRGLRGLRRLMVMVLCLVRMGRKRVLGLGLVGMSRVYLF